VLPDGETDSWTDRQLTCYDKIIVNPNSGNSYYFFLVLFNKTKDIRALSHSTEYIRVQVYMNKL